MVNELYKFLLLVMVLAMVNHFTTFNLIISIIIIIEGFFIHFLDLHLLDSDSDLFDLNLLDFDLFDLSKFHFN